MTHCRNVFRIMRMFVFASFLSKYTVVGRKTWKIELKASSVELIINNYNTKISEKNKCFDNKII